MNSHVILGLHSDPRRALETCIFNVVLTLYLITDNDKPPCWKCDLSIV